MFKWILIKIKMNHRGIGLVEAVISAGLVSLLIYGMTGLVDLSSKGSAFAEQRVQAANLMMQVRFLLATTENCNRNFQGEILPTVEPSTTNTVIGKYSQLLDTNNQVIFDINSPTPYGAVYIHDIRLSPLRKPNVDSFFGSAAVWVYFRAASPGLGSRVFPLRTDIIIENTNLDGETIFNCIGSNDAMKLWEGDGDNVYYAGGNVIIGQPNVLLPPDPAKDFPTYPLKDPSGTPERDPTTGPDPLEDFLTSGSQPPPLLGVIGTDSGIVDPGGNIVPKEDVFAATIPPYAWSLRTQEETHALAYYYRSDVRLKKNIQPLAGLDLVTKLRGIRYQSVSSGSKGIGFVAQEVAQVLPQAVHSRPDGGLAVSYEQLLAPIIEAVKEIDHIHQKQQQELNRIERVLKRY